MTIPANRMKSGIQHVVPLSAPAMEILHLAWSKQPHHSKGYIFPPQRSSKALDHTMLNRIPREMGLPFVPHGLRASFGKWAEEHKNPEYKLLAKVSLAHSVNSDSDKPYFRSDLIDKRRPMLEEYAAYLTKTVGYIISPKDR